MGAQVSGSGDGVFVSYRHQDAAFARALQVSLDEALGASSVTRDVGSIRGGDDLRAVIPNLIDRCSAVIVVVGPGWRESGTDGPVLQRGDDWVRLELSLALAWRKRVVPVLVGGEAMPTAARLPRDVRQFADIVGVPLRDSDWAHDIDRIAGLIDPTGTRRRTQPHGTVTNAGPVAGGDVTITGDVVAGRDIRLGDERR